MPMTAVSTSVSLTTGSSPGAGTACLGSGGPRAPAPAEGALETTTVRPLPKY